MRATVSVCVCVRQLEVACGSECVRATVKSVIMCACDSYYLHAAASECVCAHATGSTCVRQCERVCLRATGSTCVAQ